MTIGRLLCEAGATLRQAGIAEARLEARLLLAHALGVPREILLRDADREVATEAEAAFQEALRRRCAREPLALITGDAGFWTLDLEVSSDTLIPRPDSEAVVRLALALSSAPARVLDLGTGTGCLLLSVLAEREGAWGLGLDLRPGAAALARRNAGRNGLGGRCATLAGDWGAALAGRFDLVLSNPPYIETEAVAGLMPEVARFEPGSALDGGVDGLDAYRAILADLPRLLAPGGVAVLEVGIGQAGPVRSLGEGEGLVFLAGEADLGGIPRAVAFKAIGEALRTP
ncbi:peptide chain release factor N(5)-glutamine methyltransferase [Sabulicella glaciei]|uniref:Release factor glutamine methyltransferase n=1 Tax=Sabulicella glaciei TaxID=2984948 RepID=A0ABT3NXU3_9PROT|nr:peptide chain release factor N(5)-glutamine methyltransferase [Roseococcus sp. MDT2-1-1]MCW8086991.1 peptide chain release factor N(5)-glutamine methyltransferase [Roseococcus sp. MDT2-1-1]